VESFCLEEKYGISDRYLIPGFQFAIFNWNAVHERAEMTFEIGQHYFAVVRFDHAVMWGDRGVFEADSIVGVAADGHFRTQRKFGCS